MIGSEHTETYLTDMGRSTSPPSNEDIGLVQMVLTHHLGHVLASVVRGPAVDIGCGRGEALGALANLGFSPVEGCDRGIEQVRAAMAAGFAVEHTDGLSFVKARCGLAWVSAFDVLEHVAESDLPELLAAICRSLSDDGVFVARFPNPSSPFFGAIQFGDPSHRNIVGPGALAVLLRRAGFATWKFMPVRPTPHGIKSTIRSVVWRLVEALLYVARVAETGSVGGPLTQNCLVVARKLQATALHRAPIEVSRSG
jgi:SAM-dependent methyltransferase